MSERLNSKDIYTLDIYDVDKLEEAKNKPGLFAGIIVLIFLAQLVLLKNCPWYVAISFMLEVTCCLPIIICFLAFIASRDKFYSWIYDLTYGSIDSYSKVMIIGALVNIAIDLITCYFVKTSIESIIIACFSLLFIVISLASKSYVHSLTWRIRHYIGKEKKTKVSQ